MSQPYHPPAPYPQPVAAGYSEPLFQIGLLKHTGAVIFWHQQSSRYTGTLQQCEQAYKDAQTHCLLAGWWSLGSLVVLNWIALFSNMRAIRQVRTLAQNPHAMANQQPFAQQQPLAQQQPFAQQPPFAQQQPFAQQPQAWPQQAPGAIPPGWYPDPSGQSGQRYWDGATWTAFTHPPTHR